MNDQEKAAAILKMMDEKFFPEFESTKKFYEEKFNHEIDLVTLPLLKAWCRLSFHAGGIAAFDVIDAFGKNENDNNP